MDAPQFNSDGHLHCFQFEVIKNKTAMKFLYLSLDPHLFLLVNEWNWWVLGLPMISLSRHSQTKVGVTNLYSL